MIYMLNSNGLTVDSCVIGSVASHGIIINNSSDVFIHDTQWIMLSMGGGVTGLTWAAIYLSCTAAQQIKNIKINHCLFRANVDKATAIIFWSDITAGSIPYLDIDVSHNEFDSSETGIYWDKVDEPCREIFVSGKEYGKYLRM
jgi:hypothetical protein